MKKETADYAKIYIGVISMSIFILCTILLWIKLTIGFSKDYMVALIGFFGSIIGGIIGGMITLRGVRMTITNQSIQDEVNKYPERMLLFHSLNSKLNKMHKNIKQIEYEVDGDYLLGINHSVALSLDYINEELDIMKLESSKIGVTVFYKITKLEREINQFIFMNEEPYHNDMERMENDFFTYLDIFENLIYELDDEEEKLTSKYEKLYNI